MSLNREQMISKGESLPRQEIKIPEWEDSVWVRSLTVGERDLVDNEISTNRNKGNAHNNLRARMLVRCCCDATGKELFTEADIPVVGKFAATILEKVFDSILKLNRIGAGAVEEAEKN